MKKNDVWKVSDFIKNHFPLWNIAFTIIISGVTNGGIIASLLEHFERFSNNVR